MKSKLLENCQIVPIIMPSDLTLGASTGDRVSMKNYRRVLFLILGTAGGAPGEDITVTVQQHVAATGGTPANLAVVDSVYSKQAATDLSAIGAFSVLTQSAAATYSDDASAEEAELWGIEIADTDLGSGYSYVSVNLNDTGSGSEKLACVIAILHEPRYGGKASAMPSAIA